MKCWLRAKCGGSVDEPQTHSDHEIGPGPIVAPGYQGRHPSAGYRAERERDHALKGGSLALR